MGMLSRTAGSLYWISRYMERAELTSRLLEVGYRIALMPNTTTGYQSEWSSILSAAGEEAGYTSKYGKPQQKDIEQYLFHDLDNPFSVAACIHRARDNGRAVRTALTTQVWDVINSGYQEVQSLARKKYKPSNLPMLCDWTTCQANLLRGAIESTQLEDEGYDFLNLGYFLERAGNTARLLDVKYYVLLPTVSSVGGDVDHYQWTTLLRAMSAYRAFRWAYGGTQTPNKVAHAGRSYIHEKTNCGVCKTSAGYACRIHRPTDPGAFDITYLCHEETGAAPCRSEAFLSGGPNHTFMSRWIDSSRAEERFAGGQFIARWWRQRHLGTGRLNGNAQPHCWKSLLD